MIRQTNQQLWAEIEQYPCEWCAAEPGNTCTSPKGRPSYPHAARMDNWREALGRPRGVNRRGTGTRPR